MPGKTKGAGKKTHTQNPGKEEGYEALSQHLEGKAWAILQGYTQKVCIQPDISKARI